MSEKRITFVCGKCGSKAVTFDANAVWNEDEQKFELAGEPCDRGICENCGGECSVERKELHDVLRVAIVRGSVKIPSSDCVKIAYSKRSPYCLGTNRVTEEEAIELAERMTAGEIIGIPVYAYVHSGETIQCSENGNPFSCQFDSARSGLAYMTAKDAAKNFPGDKTIEKAKACIREFVETFDDYLNGRICEFMIERLISGTEDDPESEWEWLDGCGGFYGDDLEKNGINEAIAEYVKQGAKIVDKR